MSERYHRRTVLGGTVNGLGLLAGCLGDGDSGGTGTVDSNSSATEYGGENDGRVDRSFTVGLPSDPTGANWDVYGGVTPYYTQVLEPLVGTSEAMEPEPLLATDWEATDDTTWVFDLREDVTFHNDEPLTADAVVHTFEAVVDHWSHVSGWIGLESGNVEAIDDRSVEFVTTEPFPTFPGTISHSYFGIVHPETDADSSTVAGTGPFRVERIESGESVTVVPFADHWRGEGETGADTENETDTWNDPALEELTFRYYEDPSTRVLALRNEELDLALEPPRNEVSELVDDDATSVDRQLAPRAGFGAVNLYEAPTNDEVFRRALAYAIDQERLVETVLEGVGEPARGPISSAIPWAARDELPAFGPDRERGADLVESSSYDGEILEILIDGSEPDDRTIAAVLQNWFGEIGVESEIRSVEAAAFYDVFREGESNVSLVNLGSNSAASDYLLRAMFHSLGTDNRQLYESEGTGIMNPGEAVDDLIDEGYRADSLEEKRDLYGEVQRRVVETGAALPLYYVEYGLARHADVTGVETHPIDKLIDWQGLSRDGRRGV
ncbi:ABC transporter substrate-binding protein [Halomontanus rarus]|uniref:ABC transporter substrate-binding protein n=1 Tax=Halomontanus rarus TaxID=3034020 RepID=UPI0023E8A2C2|nr:ABC transporter substrate-binding protein [Halovivax sp. TS33]